MAALVQEVTDRELGDARPHAAPMSGLDAHVALHRQLAVNTRDMRLVMPCSCRPGLDELACADGVQHSSTQRSLKAV